MIIPLTLLSASNIWICSSLMLIIAGHSDWITSACHAKWHFTVLTTEGGCFVIICSLPWNIFMADKAFAVMLPPFEHHFFSCWYFDGCCWVISPFAFVICSSAHSLLVKIKWLSATAAAVGAFHVSRKCKFLHIISENLRTVNALYFCLSWFR